MLHKYTAPMNTLRSCIRPSLLTMLCLLAFVPTFAIAQAPNKSLLLFSGQKKAIVLAPAEKITSQKMLSGANEEILAAAIAPDKKLMYWTEKQEGKTAIFAAQLQGDSRIGRKKISSVEGDIALLTAAGERVFWFDNISSEVKSLRHDDLLSTESLVYATEAAPIVGLYATATNLYYIQSEFQGNQHTIYRTNHEGMFKTAIYSGSPSDIRAITFGKGLLFVVGENGIRATSSEGVVLAQSAAQFKGKISATVQGEELFVADENNLYRIATTLQESAQVVSTHDRNSQQHILASSVSLASEGRITITPIVNKVGEGKTLFLYGENLPVVRSIKIGNTAVESFSQVGTNELYVQIPNGVKSNEITINFTDGSEHVITSVAVVKQPKVHSFTPTKVQSGTPVTIKGENFTDVTDVYFGGMPAQEFTVISATEIRAIPTANGTGEVTVQNAAGSDSKEGFILINPSLQIVRFQLEPLQLANMNDVQEKNAAIELTLKNNGAQTIRFRLQARISQSGNIRLQSVISRMPIMEIEPGETMVYTTNDFFRQGAMETPGSTQVTFPQGQYNVCVVVADPVNPSVFLTENICEEKNTPNRIDLSLVQQRVTQILGFNVQLTNVEADFDNYYLSGRITSLPSNDIFSFAAGTQPVFQQVAVPIRNVPSNLPQNFNALPLNGTFRLQDSVLPMTVYNWIPAVIRQQGGIIIEPRPSFSNSGWIKNAATELNLTNFVARTTGSSVSGRNLLRLPASVATALRSNIPPVCAPSFNNLYPSSWRPIIDTVEKTQWIIQGKVMEKIQTYLYSRNDIRVDFKNSGSSLTFIMTPQGNTISTLPDSIQLNKNIVMTLKGLSTRQGNNTVYNDGEVTLTIKGLNTPIKLLVHEAVLNNLNKLVSARVSLPTANQIAVSGLTFVSNARDAVIAGKDGEYTIQVAGTSRVRHKSLVSWDLTSNLTFTGDRNFTVDLSLGFPSVKLKAVSVNIEKISYQTSNQRLYIDGQVSMEIKAVEASAGNFVFGNNYFSVGRLGLKIKVAKKFEVGGYVGYDERTEIWSGGLELKVQKGTTEFSIAADFTRGPNSWSLALALSKDPGILLFSKPTAAVYVYLSQIRGNVAFDNDRWTVGIGGTITVQNSPAPGTPRLGFDIDGSVTWGGGDHTILTIAGKAYGEIKRQNFESRLELGQATISFNLNTGRINGSLNSNVNIFDLARFTALGNLLVDFDADQYYIDIEGSISIVNLLNKRGRFVVARKYSTTLTEGRMIAKYPGISIGVRNGSFWFSNNPNPFSGIYFYVQDRLVNNYGFNFNAVIVTASSSTNVDVMLWGAANTNFDIAGGVVVSASTSISASLKHVASVSGSATVQGDLSLGVRNKQFWFDGSLTIKAEAEGKINGCGAGCNSINVCGGWPWNWGAGGKICFDKTLSAWYNNRGNSGFKYSL